MKFLAISGPAQSYSPEQLKPHMKDEVPATLKLYLDGKVEQFWFRDKVGPIFLMNVDSQQDAEATLATLPLVRAGLIKYDLLPVSPLVPLRMLIQ